jgi:hypothetical protein
VIGLWNSPKTRWIFIWKSFSAYIVIYRTSSVKNLVPDFVWTLTDLLEKAYSQLNLVGNSTDVDRNTL